MLFESEGCTCAYFQCQRTNLPQPQVDFARGMMPKWVAEMMGHPN